MPKSSEIEGLPTPNREIEGLTRAQAELLALIEPGRPISVRDAASILGKPLCAVSGVRNALADRRLIARWHNYDDALRITDAGRAALARSAP